MHQKRISVFIFFSGVRFNKNVDIEFSEYSSSGMFKLKDWKAK